MSSSLPPPFTTPPSSTSPTASTPAIRERKSTNKYTQKNNRFRDKLRKAGGHKFAVTNAQTANNTHISKTKAALFKIGEAELQALSDEDRRLASVELKSRCRQHSVLSMLYSGIHWVQKAREIAPNDRWPSVNDIFRREGITSRQYHAFEPNSQPGNSPAWDIDLAKFRN